MPKKVFAIERQQKILKFLSEKNAASVTDLASYFNVTETTIRRDLLSLDKQNKIQRTHGGAINLEQNLIWNYTPLTDRIHIESDAKHRIASYIAENLINDHESIMIDGGSTTLNCAQEISKKFSSLMIITNTERIGALFAGIEQNKVIITGGEFIGQTQVQVGNFAERIIRSLRANKTIISATGLISDQGIFASNPPEAEIKRLMIENSNTTILAIDSSKFMVNALSFVEDFSKIDILVTDKNAPNEEIKKIESYNVRVIKV